MNAPLETDAQEALARAQRQAAVVAALLKVVPAHAVLYTDEDTVPYATA